MGWHVIMLSISVLCTILFNKHPLKSQSGKIYGFSQKYSVELYFPCLTGNFIYSCHPSPVDVTAFFLYIAFFSWPSHQLPMSVCKTTLLQQRNCQWQHIKTESQATFPQGSLLNFGFDVTSVFQVRVKCMQGSLSPEWAMTMFRAHWINKLTAETLIDLGKIRPKFGLVFSEEVQI